MATPSSPVPPESNGPDSSIRSVDIERSFGPFEDLEGAFGVTFDGGNIWVAGGGELIAFDPETEQEKQRIPVPADAGTAFDGRFLYQIGGGEIRKIDPQSGGIVHRIPAPEGEGAGLAWAEGSLWIGQHEKGLIRRIDPETGEVQATLKSDRFVTGICWTENELWHGVTDAQGSELRRIDHENGEVLERLVAPGGVIITGLESPDGDSFLCGGGPSGKVNVVRRRARD